MKKYALLIGIDRYHLLSGLKFCKSDARSMAEVLRANWGFEEHEITLMTEDTQVGGLRPLSAYVQRRLESLPKELDLLVVGFWGHGFSNGDGERFLCCLETLPEDIERTSISRSALLEGCRQAGAKACCVLLDCCQNQALGRDIVLAPVRENESNSLTHRLAAFSAPIAVLNSCSSGEHAYEWEARQHGIFTAHLLDGLKSGIPSVRQLADYLAPRVLRTADDIYLRAQTPYLAMNSELANISFPFRPAKPEPVPQSNPAPQSHPAPQSEAVQKSKPVIPSDFMNSLSADAEKLFQEGVRYAGMQPPDYASAGSCFQQAAALGHIRASNQIGWYLYSGTHFEQNFEQAVRRFRVAAVSGLAEAQNNMGLCFQYGRGVPQNGTEAVHWYRLAAEQNLPEALNNLGVCYEDGVGVPKDMTQAVAFYRKSAALGCSAAQNALDRLAGKTPPGTPKHLVPKHVSCGCTILTALFTAWVLFFLIYWLSH